MDAYSLPGPLDPAVTHRDAVFARFGEEMLSARSQRQRELSDLIYRRLHDGAEMDQIEHLVTEMTRTAAEDHRRRYSGRAGGPS